MVSQSQILAAVREFFQNGLTPELAALLKGPKGDPGENGIQGPPWFNIGAFYPTASSPTTGSLGGVTVFGAEQLMANTLVATGHATLAALTVQGNTTLTGGLVVGGTASVSTLILNGTQLTPGSVPANSLDFSSLSNALTLDANTTIASGGFSLTFGTGSLKGDGQQLTLAHIGDPTFSTIQDLQNVFHSAGWIDGGTISDIGGGKVSVGSGNGTIRISDSATATVEFFTWPASSSVTIPNNTHVNVGVTYNNGNPKVLSTTDDTIFNHRTNFEIAEVINENGQLFITFNPEAPGDHPAKMIQREYETMPVMRDMLGDGLILTDSGDGNRHVLMSAGAVWDRLNRFAIGAIDTSAGGNFDRYYRDGSGGFTKEASQVQWPNTKFDDGSGTLATIADGKYAVLWFYVNTNGAVSMIYGRGEYSSAREAQTEKVPDTVPVRLEDEASTKIGRMIFQKSATIPIATQSAFEESFNPIFDQIGFAVANGAAFTDNIASLSFSASAFNVNFNTNTSAASVSLDWVNGPASRSIDQTITGDWTFSGANLGLLVTNNASVSGNFEIGGTLHGLNVIAGVASISSTLEAIALKTDTLGSDGGLTINPQGLLTLSPTTRTLITTDASVSGAFEVTGQLDATSTLTGAGLSTCNGTTQKLTWINGQFGCGVDQSGVGGGGGTNAFEVREFGAAFDSFPASLSFAKSGFNLTASGSTDVTIGLDYINGPASRSIAQTITGQWTFANASVSGAFEVGGYASASKYFGAALPNCSAAGGKLLYNSTTGQFTCGTDVGGGAIFEGLTNVVATPHDLIFDAGGFTITASTSGGVSDALIKLDYANGPASRSATQTITGAWTFTNASISNNFEIGGTASVSGTLFANGGLTSAFTASNSFSGSLEISKGMRVRDLSITGSNRGLTFTGGGTNTISSTGTLQIGAVTLTGLVTGNNQTITGLAQLNTANASASSTIEAIQLRSGTLGADAGMSIQPTGQLTLAPGTGLTQVTGTASVSGAFEIGGYASASKYFSGGLTDCDSYGQRIIWTASGSNAGKFGCTTNKVTATYTSGVAALAANTVTNAGIFVNTNTNAFSIVVGANTASSSFRATTGGSFRGCAMVLDSNVTAGAVAVVFRVNNVTVDGEYCRLSTTNTKAKSETVPGGMVTFAAGDDIGIAVSTSVGFTPTGIEAMVDWTVDYGSGADVAETYYTHDTSISPGMVVALDESLYAGVQTTSRSYDPTSLGVISTTPGLLLGDTRGPGRGVYVALSGRVPVWVSSENGPIAPGDWLTTSSTPGAAMKATRAGRVIGQALEGFSGNGIGQVIMFVKNTSFEGENSLDQALTGISDGKQLLASVSPHGDSLATPASSSHQLPVILDAFAILASRTAGLEQFVIDTKSMLTDAHLGLAQNLASVSQRFDLLSLRVDALASASAAGMTFSTPVEFHGGLRLDTITSLDTAIQIMSDTFFFGHPYFNADTAGFALIDPDVRRAHITYDQPYLQTPVVVVTLANPASPSGTGIDAVLDQNLQAAVTESDTTGFTVVLSHAPSSPVQINWVSLAVTNARTVHATPEPRILPTPLVTPDISAPASASDQTVVTPTPTESPPPELSPSESPPVETPPVETPTPTPDISSTNAPPNP